MKKGNVTSTVDIKNTTGIKVHRGVTNKETSDVDQDHEIKNDREVLVANQDEGTKVQIQIIAHPLRVLILHKGAAAHP